MGNHTSSLDGKPRVVIIGGGYGGVAAAQALDGKVNVAIVEKRPTFNHKISNLRSLVKPEWSALTEIPYNNDLTHGNVITSGVQSITESTVVLEDGKVLPYDYAVIATGTSIKAPAKPPAESVQAAQVWYRRSRCAISSAHRITIIGGGAVGLELAGEIRAEFPEKSITVVHSGPRLLHTTDGLTPKFYDTLRHTLEELRIDVVLNSRVQPPATPSDKLDRSAYDQLGMIVGQTHLMTETGDSIATDLQFWAGGSHIANTEFCRGGPLQATLHHESGRVLVNECGQLVGFPRVFAVGDVAQWPAGHSEQHLGYFAQLQGEHVASNILKLAAGQQPTVYASHGTQLALVLGPEHGVAQFPIGSWPVVVGSCSMKLIKSRRLLTDRFWKTFKQPMPDITAAASRASDSCKVVDASEDALARGYRHRLM